MIAHEGPRFRTTTLDAIEDHTEGDGAEEMYVVVRGHARFTVDGEELDAPAGTIVFLHVPEARRKAVAIEDGTAVLAVGGIPGRAHEISAWEERFYQEGVARRDAVT